MTRRVLDARWSPIRPCWIVALIALGGVASAQEGVGSIRGNVLDGDFEAPLPLAQVTIVETGQRVRTTDSGNYVFGQVAPGQYTLVFSRSGYVRQVRTGVVVRAGELTDLDASLAAEFTEMDEFVVADVLQLGAGSEAALLELRFDSPAMMDSISSELMSRAGASDAASALRLVAGASTQDGKSAVIRGLPDRYVSSQMNGVRLPTADEDKRAVELDQFPGPVIESIRVTKTFTPDQQGDASGGAVDVRLKGIPDETIVQFNAQLGYNSQVRRRDDFLTYDGGGVDFLGRDDRDPQLDLLGESWDGAVGVRDGDAPVDSKWSLALGGRREGDAGLTIGGFASLFYERDSSYHDDGVEDSWWVDTPGEGLTPQYSQGAPSPSDPQDGDFKTSLFDVRQATELVQWGGVAAVGMETEGHELGLTFLYSRTAEDTATLAEDTRGKEHYFPGYDPTDPTGPGNTPDTRAAAPWLRLETLEYTERQTGTLQLDGRHELPDFWGFRVPEVEWVLAHSFADLNQPDKRQFGSLWLADSFNQGVPPFIPPSTSPATHLPFKPAANFNLGNLQRIWKEIEEESNQGSVNLKLPFEQWSDDEGYLKLGVFSDTVDRKFDQDTFSNFGDAGASYEGPWEDFWSDNFPFEDHPVTASRSDVDYDGDQDVFALYSMVDLPLAESVNLIGGARFEKTELRIVNAPEAEALWYEPGSSAPSTLEPGEADVDFEQDDLLPAAALVWEATDEVTLRAAYSETIARQTFKEVTPILQQEFAGGPVFIGNPDLGMSELHNYDLRADFAPREGTLVSASWFHKRIIDPIEYVQTVGDFSYTTPRNYPRGKITGVELEVREQLGHLWQPLDGLSIGANGTWIHSRVELPEDEAAGFDLPGVQAPIAARDMTDAPEHLYNLYLTYDIAATNTQLSLFWTVQGDTLVAGAAQDDGNFVPSVYAKEYDTLNLSVVQRIGEHFSIKFQAKNLTNPEIEEVYRSRYIGDDMVKTSETKGIDYALGFGFSFRF